MRKRTIIIGIAALELAAIPALAFIDTPSFDFDRTYVIAAEIDSPAGLKRYFVNSNAPFDIVAKDFKGPIFTTIKAHGQIGEVQFGENAQMTGTLQNCVTASSVVGAAKIIFKSTEGTITGNGSPVSQAVLVTIVHDLSQNPEIQFLKNQDSKDFPQAEAC